MFDLELVNQVKQRVITGILGDSDLGSRMVLKGGNLLQFAYELTTRASKDVDISIDGEFSDADELGSHIHGCLVSSFEDLNLVVVDFTFSEVPSQMSDDLRSFWGGYKCEFKLVNREFHRIHGHDIEALRRHARPLDPSGSTKFKVDFSRHEFCEEKEEFEINGHTVFGYSPRMFVAEKLRAICQQMPEYGPIVHRNRQTASRARDFVDIHAIWETYGINWDDPSFHDVVRKTFLIKKVPLEWLGRIAETRDQHEPDFQSVKDTVVPAFRSRLQTFDFYFRFVCDRCWLLKPLWDV